MLDTEWNQGGLEEQSAEINGDGVCTWTLWVLAEYGRRDL